MAGQIVHKSLIEITYPSGQKDTRSLSKTVTSLTEIGVREVDVSASATITLWDAAATSETINSISYLTIGNTGANSLYLELVIDDNATHGEELTSLVLPASTQVTLFSDAAFANHSAGDSFAGTLDKYERIRVKEPNAVAGNILFIIGK
jgi:hypothetical protein